MSRTQSDILTTTLFFPHPPHATSTFGPAWPGDLLLSEVTTILPFYVLRGKTPASKPAPLLAPTPQGRVTQPLPWSFCFSQPLLCPPLLFLAVVLEAFNVTPNYQRY